MGAETNKMAKKSASKSNARRRELLDAAAELFSKRGYDGTSMRDVAAHVGKTPGSLYYHFKSKDDLVIAAFKLASDYSEEIFAESSKGVTDPWERLELACIAHMRALHDKTGYSSVVSRILPAKNYGLREELIKFRQQTNEFFKELIADLPLETEEDRKYFRLTLFGAMNYSDVWYRPNRDTPTKIARSIVQMMRYELIPSK